MPFNGEMGPIEYIFQPRRSKAYVRAECSFRKKRVTNEKGVWIGDWQPQNIRDFVKYTISKGYKVDSYEFGNQLYGLGIGARVDANHSGKMSLYLKSCKIIAYSEFLDKQQILLWMFSRTHELTNKLISEVPRSNRQATKRTPSLSVNRRKRTKHKPDKNYNFDFLLKRFVWIFNLNEKLAKISTKPTRINKRAKFGNSFRKDEEIAQPLFPGKGFGANPKMGLGLGGN
ncbi:hypothetical protein GQ457_05G020810 [Hibiscus cannabinus]